MSGEKTYPRVIEEYMGRRLVAVGEDETGRPTVVVERRRIDAMGEPTWTHVKQLTREVADIALTLGGEVLP